MEPLARSHPALRHLDQAVVAASCTGNDLDTPACRGDSSGCQDGQPGPLRPADRRRRGSGELRAKQGIAGATLGEREVAAQEDGEDGRGSEVVLELGERNPGVGGAGADAPEEGEGGASERRTKEPASASPRTTTRQQRAAAW